MDKNKKKTTWVTVLPIWTWTCVLLLEVKGIAAKTVPSSLGENST